MQLYFGPNLRYFFHDGKGNFRYRAPPDFLKLFKAIQVTTIHSVAFGEGESYYISYSAVDGTNGAWFELEEHYPKLHSWLHLEGLTHIWPQVYISLGQNGAFFAYSNQGHRWRNIPEDAADYYQKFTRPDLFLSKRIRSIDLGVKDTFSGIQEDNTWFWDLADEYPHLSSLDLATEMSRAQWMTLNPFARDQHFAVFNDGSTHYSLPQEWAGDIASLFQQYASQTVQARRPSRFGRLFASSGSSTTASAGQPQHPQQPSTVNQAFQLANNALDTYNNVTNTGGQSSGSAYGGTASTFDVNQAMTLMQSSVDTINTVAGGGGQGLDLMNQI
ncbi:hypothetical protein LTR53_016219, partial [Teratosphaeriaceae sp. CCFEE 6253]